MLFLAELKRRIEEQLEDPGSAVSCVLSPHQLTIYYRGEIIGSWQAAENEGARGHGALEQDANSLILYDVYDAMQVTLRELFVFVRNFNWRIP